VPVPEPGRLQRVHREHQVPGRHQRRHPRAAVSLDPDQHLAVIGILTEETADQLVQLRDTARPLGQPPLRQHLPGPVHHFHVMMIFSPVITHEQLHQNSRQQYRKTPAASERAISNLIKQCSRPRRDRRDIPAAINSPGHRQGHDLSQGLHARAAQVLTCRRPPHCESAVTAHPLTLIRSARFSSSRISTHGSGVPPSRAASSSISLARRSR
jgi:hypothetical protein